MWRDQEKRRIRARLDEVNVAPGMEQCLSEVSRGTLAWGGFERDGNPPSPFIDDLIINGPM